MIRKFFTHWDSWWFREVPPHALAIARIGFGVFFFFYIGQYLFRSTALFSNAGIALPYYADSTPDFLQQFIFAPEPLSAQTLLLLWMACFLGIALGFSLRFCIVVAIGLSFYFWQIFFHFHNSTVFRIYLLFLFIFLFSGADATFSLRMLREKGSFFAWRPISILPQRLMALQISVTYMGSGWQKLWLPHWQSGEMLLNSLISPWASPLGRSIAALNLPMRVYDKSIFLVKFFFFLLPFGLWVRNVRMLFIVCAILFHVSVALLLNIYEFLAFPLVYVLFFDPEEVYSWCKLRSKGRIS